MPTRSYHVIVIGGGHAGAEAAWAAANLLPAEPGRPSIALITLDPSKIGVMSCNPAIGGLAKGQLVREIDALGGLMGLATDATGIQFKVLNTSKGQAVHGPRAQCDKHAYADTVRALIASRPEIEVIAGSVEELIIEDGRIRGVAIKANGQIANGQMANDGAPESAAPSSSLAPPHQHLPFGNLPFGNFNIVLTASSVVLTTGTFMRGLMHTGETRTPGGRHGEAAAEGISGALRRLGFELGRLKTGTPPRLKRSTIDWDNLPAQRGDDPPVPFSDLSGSSLCHSVTPSLRHFPYLQQVACRQTHTTAAAHDLIRANLHRAPMYSGQIESTGPRYCPSIEDKVVRFADRPTHGVFLEPESLRDDWIYCNGISTSLPADIQDRIVRSMPGCEHAEIYRYGYAVEYDMVRPHQIHATGETKRIAGLFLAGQINGTSGYEEAAAQGFLAGLNAARRALGQDPVTLGRDEAYIGVLMDDLVTKTPVEPYRMFTSRAEHRLLLRADNAADRLTPRAVEWGLLDSTELGRARRRLFDDRQRQIRELNAAIDRIRVEGQPLAKLLRTPDFTCDDLARAIATSNPPTEAPTDAASEPILPREQDRAEIGSPLPREQDRAEIGPPLPRERERAGVRASSTTHASPASTSSASSFSSSSSSPSSTSSSSSPSHFSSSSPAPRPEGERLLPGASAPGEARHLSSFSFKPPPPGGRTSQFSPSVLSTVFAERRYEAYIARQHAEIKRHAEMEHRRLPDDLDYNDLMSLRTEARTALSKFRPETFGQAGRLEGITPADLTLLAVLVQKHKKRVKEVM